MKEKFYDITIIRFGAMSFIVICHMLQFYDMNLAWWFNVGVEVFLFMSGYLYGLKRIREPIGWLKHNFIKILTDYWVYIFIISVIYIVFAREVLSARDMVGMFFTMSQYKGVTHLWYVNFILLCYLLTPILQYIYDKVFDTKSEWFMWTVVCISIGVLYLMYQYHVWMYSASRLMCYIVGYFLAKRYVAQKKEYDFLSESKITKVILIISGLWIVIRAVVEQTGGRINIYDIVKPFLHGITGMGLFLGGRVIFAKITMDERKKKVLNILDKYSYDMYIVHQIFILGPFSLMELTGNIVFNIVLIVICIIVSAVCLRKLVEMSTIMVKKIALRLQT